MGLNTFLATLFATCAGMTSVASATEPMKELIWDTRGRQWIHPIDLPSHLQNGEILVIGEQHFTDDADLPLIIQHENQSRLVSWVSEFSRQVGLKGNVGLEFLYYPSQPAVDDFLGNKLSEGEFLKAVDWSGPFAPYRELMLRAREHGGKTLALNMPRAITSQVAKGGPESLSEEQRALLPPIWEQGRKEYFERFVDAIGGHGKYDNYFWAQSLWDDTMAWKATTQTSAREILALVVGRFHVEFGHGLPSRLERYGARKVSTLVQEPLTEWSHAEFNRAIADHPKYGPKADYIWIFLPNKTSQ